MILKMYSDVVLNELKTNREKNKTKYNGNKFVSNMIENYEDKLYSTEVIVEYPVLNDTKCKNSDEDSQWEVDCSNAIKLHQELILKYNVPMMYLSDERFISYLTHDIYWDYMQKRWPYNDKLSRIEQKYFLPSGNQGFTRNMFLRFFWYTYITYMKDFEDPYELTKIAFAYADPVNQIMERSYGRNQKIVVALLIAIRDTPNSKVLNQKRTILGKTVNNILSMYSLDCLKLEDLIELFSNEIKKIVKSDIVDDEQIEEE